MTRYVVQGMPLIIEPLAPTFWRAPSDNDFGNHMPARCEVWKNAMNDAVCDGISVTRHSSSKWEIRTEIQLPSVEGKVTLGYTVGGDGQVGVAFEFSSRVETNAEIPRIGMVTKLPKSIDQLDFYGRGPWENYADRCGASFVGREQSTVGEQYVPYGRPQENGHKTDVRWLRLTNHVGVGLEVTSMDQPFEFNALHYSTADLDPGMVKRLRTTRDIQEGDFTSLNIDLAMTGVGGDNTWGAKAHPPHLLMNDRPYAYGFNLVPVRR